MWVGKDGKISVRLTSTFFPWDQLSLKASNRVLFSFVIWCEYEVEYSQDSLNSTRLRWSVSFLPLARSSATLDYYFAVTEESGGYGDGAIADGVTKVVAMDLGAIHATSRTLLCCDV